MGATTVRESIPVKVLIYVFLILAVIVSIYPIYWIYVASTLSDGQIFHFPPSNWFGDHLLQNVHMLESTMPVWRDLANSIVVSGITTISVVFFSAMVGFAFAKYRFWAKSFLFFVVLITIMIPMQTTLIPLFIIVTKLHWENSYQGLIVPFLVNGFGVFFMRQQMQSFPSELLEASRIDGASEFYTFFRIVMPNMLPSMAALGILTFLQQWGNFIWPLIVINSRNMSTIPLMLEQLDQPGNVIHYGPIFAGAAIGLIPLMIVFIALQRYFISGMYSGSVKG
ncbi:binding-protein-dependent transport systems inner membrane component [Alicyclobacillus acidocaldarius subsp. acidocaldarius Tc-4-1]|uniref:Binding-protein-dependent transport systems inner membrane component n=1 Tax=Alicyclobacillus acidocaldarius (strain Tc-4-1) TaxID=1048834 RepID=F8IGG1_ALIAT|nr:binding-protein-dependent transport systems inner membrane component [Alicyclobacillus acidocaldarius subsp. acidocaldarius Tc-4-1]